MMIDDDDVAFLGLASHLGDEAALPLLTFATGALIGARVELLPELRVFRKVAQFGAVSGLGGLFPFRDLAVLFDFIEAREYRLGGQVVELLPAKAASAPLHVANLQPAQMVLQRGD